MSAELLSDNAPLDPDDELLVAYVDGELDNQLRGGLEERLLEDEALRRRLQELQRGWDYLDDLAGSTPNEKLVESTMELVVADLVKPQQTQHRSLWPIRWPMAVTAISLASILVTAVVIGMVRSHQYRAQLADLAIAENLDAYYYGNDLQLMRGLAINESWAKTIALMREIGDLQTPKPLVANLPMDQRESVIAEMPLADRAQLGYRWNRFERLKPEDQERLRATASEAADQPDSDRLLETMQAYAVWRETLPSDLRDKIESNNLDERREAIRIAMDKTQLDLSRRSGEILSDETIERIDYTLHRILDERLRMDDPKLKKFMERFSKGATPEQVEMIAINAMVMTDGGRSGRWGGGFIRGMADRPAPLNANELDMIKWWLPDEDHETLDLIAGDPRNPFMESETLRYWAGETVKRKSPWRNEDPRSLLQRYQQIDDDEYRLMLDLMPPKEMLDRLVPEQRR
ncbi:anti-sigma factor family protein [Novipirellula artificiosorum]|uniref:Uncharacterized protein n=1 Tax=Novipirellula artificiosorum TaxID=2528016 RepID=A0A5C6DFH6_9BACT|nr:hypothetical protein [Novipirellula artificiosorum]TWU36003.1 hypothetical protein Poly41_37550 [Novipirellula artificiosorum]